MPSIQIARGQRPPTHPDVLSPVFWSDGRVVMLDQRLVPQDEVWTAYDDPEDIARAIRDMEVRGAPAIGCAAAFGMALAARRRGRGPSLEETAARLRATRPTAVNLAAALDRMLSALHAGRDLEAEAQTFWEEDLAACRAIGAHGAALVPDGATVLTHCNAGALATAGYGTALGVIRAAHAAGKSIRVLCDETRPWLQGARLTAWELHQDGIPAEVIVDGAAAHFMSRGQIQFAVTGADRIAANGDTANKIGTCGVAAAAHVFGVPMVVAAPRTTIDRSLPDGTRIPIEDRGADEVAVIAGRRVLAPGIGARNPVFDVTPARLIAAIVTETGIHRPPYTF